ncbi:MAG: hypothetical protein KIT35_23470 [Piscinibacter sp.]|uniref:hypothetical protein n=1 Tax=Piscinibacter sp. TaxID=1903157 RepID=UPI00258CFAD3|nr:hypothetical protein [Piscinibacter sp.]MCW5666804.1 hypothetical protein [Piscinibacter sp.]
MPTHAELLARATALLTEIAATRKGAAPEEWMRDVIRFVVDVASIDPDIARALQPGFSVVGCLLFPSDGAAPQRWLPQGLAGEAFGHASAPHDAPGPLPALDQFLLASVEAGRAKHALASVVQQDAAAIATDAYAAEATLLHAAVAIDAAGPAGLTPELLAEVLEAAAQAHFFAARAMEAARRARRDADLPSGPPWRARGARHSGAPLARC